MNKKGFVLIETLVVTIFTMFIFTILYNSIVPLLGKYKELSYYDDVDTTYDLYYLKNLIISDDNFSTIKENNYKKLTCEDFATGKCSDLYSFLDIKGTDEVLFLNTNNIDSIKNDVNVSYDIKNYLKYIDTTGNILLLQKDGYLSYINLNTFSEKLINNAENADCHSYIEEDGIIYLSGSNDCVNFNYVWYSGKLWRVTAIYPDGSVKMITEKPITAIAYGEDYNFYTNETTTSWIYQWLNEDFLDTLYNYEKIIDTDSFWNVTTGNGEVSTKLSETTMVPASVGLLNSYEYYKSYENLGSAAYENGYLNIGYYWWLSNKYNSSSKCWLVEDTGGAALYQPEFPREMAGMSAARPTINLKSTIELTGGTGTKSNPYKIKGDKEEAVSNTTLLNTRSSGEYVNFDGELYRIVGIENNTTKLNKVDYIRDDSDSVVLKSFSSSVTYGSGTADTYWDYYLSGESSTTSWYNNMSSNYKNMLVKGTYYLGTTKDNYKLAICTSSSNTVTTKNCTKTTSTWSGYVGLPRYGEMFASQLGSGYPTSSHMWLITPYPNYSEYTHIINAYGCGAIGNPVDEFNGMPLTRAARPSINLKSAVVIKSGSGTERDPFIVGLN